MKKLFFLLLLMICSVAGLSAQTPSSKPDGNRFLFVVETSSSMSRSAKAAREVVRDLMESGVQGQMRSGDSIGLWVFNDALNDTFPMQLWSPADNKQLGDVTMNFLSKVRFERKSKLQVVLPPILSVVESSKAITIILISTGSEPIRGTPFDKEINDLFEFYGRDFRSSKTPFVTILIGRDQKLVAYSVNSALGPIQIPKLPVQPEPALSQAKTNTPVATNIVVAVTNQAAPPRKIAKANIIMAPPAVTNAAAPVKALAEKTNQVAAVISTNVAPPAKIEVSITPAVTPAPTQAVTASKPSVISSATQNVAKLMEPPKAVTADPATFVSNPQSAGSETNVSTKLSLPIKTNELINRNPMPSEAETATAPAPVVAAQPLSNSRNFLIPGVALLIIASLLIFLFVNNSRSRSRSSLISRSMDQGRK